MQQRPLLETGHQYRLSRRSVLLASVIGGCFTSLLGSSGSQASEPESDQKSTVTTQTAVQKLVRQTASRTVRLKPVSVDFNNTLVQAIAADPTGKLIAVAGDDHAIRIMDTSSLALLATLQGHTDLIQTLDFSPNGNQLVSAGNDGQVIRWNRNSQFKIIQRIDGAPALACVRFAPDGGELAAVGFNNKVYLIGQTKRNGQPEVECDCTDLRAVEYRKDGKYLAVAGRNGNLHLFDRAANQMLDDFHLHSGRIHAIRFAESSPVIVTAGEDGQVVLFDTDAKQTVRRITVGGGKLFAVCILDQEHLAVAGSNNMIGIVNLSLGRIVERLIGHTGSVTTLASSGSMLFSGGFDATLRRWELSGLQNQRDRIAEREIPIDR